MCTSLRESPGKLIETEMGEKGICFFMEEVYHDESSVGYLIRDNYRIPRFRVYGILDPAGDRSDLKYFTYSSCGKEIEGDDPVAVAKSRISCFSDLPEGILQC